MVVKIFGGFLIIFSMWSYGFYLSYKESFRENDLKELKRALNILINEINFAMETLEVSFENISQKVNHPMNNIFSQISKKLNEKKHISMDQIWEQTIKDNINNTYLNKDDEKNFISLGKTLGYLDTNMQISAINILIEYIDEEKKLINGKKASNKKLYQSLSILGSFLVIIILI